MDAQTRIKIENGRITDRIQKQQIKAPSGRMDVSRTSDVDIAKLTGWLVPVYADPAGGRITASHWETDGVYAQQMIDAYLTAEEVAALDAQAEADAQTQAQLDRYNKVLAMTDAYGGMIAALGYSLKAVGHEIPCESADVTSDLIQRSLDGTLTPAQQSAKSDIADIYIMLAGRGVTDLDIAAVWSNVKNRG